MGGTDLRVLRTLRRGVRVDGVELSARERIVIAWRARIVLALFRGATNTAVAVRFHTSLATVGKWRSRFLERGVDGLLEGRTARSGTKASHDLMNAVKSRLAQGVSTRAVAQALRVSQSTVARLARSRAA
jgi:transposase